MAINTNDTGSLKALPATPEIPSNVGKLDVGAIYDRVVQGLQTETALGENATDQVAHGSTLATQILKNRQTQQLIPSQTQAELATNAATAAQAPLGTVIKQTEADKAEQTTPSSIAATISANDAADVQNQVSKIYADANLKVAPDIANATSQLQSGLYKRLKDSGNGMVTAPLTGPGGQPLGTMLVYTSPDGTPKTQVVPVPYGALSHINTGVQYTPIGHKIDPATNQPTGMQWQTVYPNAAGGITRGEIVTTGLDEGPPGQVYQPAGTQAPLGQASAPGVVAAQAPAAPLAAPAVAQSPAATDDQDGSALLAAPPAAPAPAALAVTPAPATAPSVGGRIGAQVAAKNIEELNNQRREFLQDLPAQASTFDKADAALDKLRGDLDAQSKSTILNSGVARQTGLAAHTPEGQQVDSDVSNFVSSAMEGAKNVRTQQEFNAYTGQVAKSGQYEGVQNSNYAYMRNANNVMKQRVAFMQQEAAKNPNFDPSQLRAEAAARFPLAPGGTPPQPAPPPAAGGTAPAGDHPQTGQVYQDAQGNKATWDGTKYVPVT